MAGGHHGFNGMGGGGFDPTFQPGPLFAGHHSNHAAFGIGGYVFQDDAEYEGEPTPHSLPRSEGWLLASDSTQPPPKLMSNTDFHAEDDAYFPRAQGLHPAQGGWDGGRRGGGRGRYGRQFHHYY
jgi:hypothetical protein